MKVTAKGGKTKSRVKRYLAGAAAMLITPLAFAIGIAAPAQANPANYCNYRTACVWDDPAYNTNGNYAGLLWFEYYVENMSNFNYHGTNITAGNTADSWFNNGAHATACFYDYANYGGSYRCLAPGQGDGNIANHAGIIQGVKWDPNSAKFI